MRVLFTSLSGLGHVHPMLPLALALQVRGHEVRWAVAAQTCSRIEQAGIKAIAAGLDFSPGVEEYRRRYPRPRHCHGRSVGRTRSSSSLAKSTHHR